MTITKEQIVNSIYNNLDLPKARSAQIVESFLEIMKKRLEDGEDILISGFGKFCVKDKSERRGRNPTTGEDLMLGSRRVVVFKCSGVLKDKLNGKSD
jgi:integration host factor subunit alpha